MSNPSNRLGTLPNQFGVNANQFGFNTNQFRTNFLAGSTTNGALTPTSQPGATNRIFSTNDIGGPLGTNIFSPTNNGGFILRDVAITPTDRALLMQIRQTGDPQTSSFGAWSPANFLVRNGVVTLAGYVPALQERQRIEALVRATPGVLGVVNNLQVVSRDQAIAPTDVALLTQIRRAVQPEVTRLGAVPLHFIVRNGMVTIVGAVPDADARQRIEALVTKTPGVAGIVNRSGEGAMMPGNAAATAPASSASSAPAVTNQFGTDSIPSPTSRTNSSRLYRNELPNGLQNRDELPPGLQNREQLPPGLANPTNSSGPTP